MEPSGVSLTSVTPDVLQNFLAFPEWVEKLAVRLGELYERLRVVRAIMREREQAEDEEDEEDEDQEDDEVRCERVETRYQVPEESSRARSRSW